MFNQTFYHKTLRKYVTLFGTLFNNIYLNRVDDSNNNVQTLKVPITYGPKTKILTRADSDPNLNRPFQINLPAMAFEMTGLDYAAERKLPTVKKHNVYINTLNSEQHKYVYNPVPYDIDFTLFVAVKNAEDGTRILEQILPYFAPEWNSTVNLIPDLGVKLDIPVYIKSVRLEDNYEGPIPDTRTIVWSLDFTMKGYLFGPVKKAEVIKLANVNFFSAMSNTSLYENVTIYPGLLANGSPTTNAELTINRSQINENDDWDYIVIYSEKNDE